MQTSRGTHSKVVIAATEGAVELPISLTHYTVSTVGPEIYQSDLHMEIEEALKLLSALQEAITFARGQDHTHTWTVE